MRGVRPHVLVRLLLITVGRGLWRGVAVKLPGEKNSSNKSPKLDSIESAGAGARPSIPASSTLPSKGSLNPLPFPGSTQGENR